MKNSLLWRIGTAALVIGSVLYTARSGRRSGRSEKEDEEDNRAVRPEYQTVFDKNLIIPDGWTFGVVWSTIYAGTTAYAIHQALPAQQANPRYRRAAPWLAVSYVLNAIFGRLFSDPHRESRLASDLVTKASLPVALMLHHQLEIGETEVDAPEKYLRIPVSLYAGWLTVASVVGTPNLLLDLKLWKPDPQRDVPLSIGILSATAGAGYAIARRLNDPYYLLPFVAGFAGIATRQHGKHQAITLVAGLLTLAYVGLLAKSLPKGRFNSPEREDRGETTEWDEDEYGWEDGWNDEAETYSYTSL